jgi:hypothetical protein
MLEWWVNAVLERYERIDEGLIEELPRNWPGVSEGNRENSIRIFGVPAEIRTARLWDLWWTKWQWGRFSASTSVFPPNSHSTKFSVLLSSGADTICQLVADVPSGLSQSDSTIRNRKKIPNKLTTQYLDQETGCPDCYRGFFWVTPTKCWDSILRLFSFSSFPTQCSLTILSFESVQS